MDINSSVERMKQLMNHGSQDSSLKANVSETVEYKVNGPDGKVYGIVREKQKYFIKESNDGITFNYIGGIGNKSENEYLKYNSAYRNLELKIRSINESLNNGKTFEVLPTNTTSEYIVEATQDMRNEIDRQREIMMGVSKIMNEKNEFINKPKFKDVESFGTATDPKKQGDPFTDNAKAVLDKDPNFKATDPKKQGAPYSCDTKPKEDKFDIEKTKKSPSKSGEPFTIDAEDVLGDSVATKKPKGGKVIKVTESQLSMIKKYLNESMFQSEDNILEYDEYDDSEDLGVLGNVELPDNSSDFDEVYKDNDSITGRKSSKPAKASKPNINMGNDLDDIEDEDSNVDYGNQNVFNIPSKVKYVGNDPKILSNVPSGKSLDYLGQKGKDMSYVMVTKIKGNGTVSEVEHVVPTKDLIKVGLNEGVWDALKGVGSVGKYFGNKATQGVKQGVQNTYNKAANAVNNIKQQGSQIYNQSQAQSSQDRIDKIASNLANELRNLNDRTIKSGGQPLNYNSVITSLSNKLRGVMRRESIEENDELINEITEAVLNSFGKHPTYQKPAFTTPSSKGKLLPGTVEWDDESAKGEVAYGQKIGDSSPFTKPVKQVVGKGEIGSDADETMKGKTQSTKPNLGEKGDTAPFKKPVKQKIGTGEIGADADETMKGKKQSVKPNLGKKGDTSPFKKKIVSELTTGFAKNALDAANKNAKETPNDDLNYRKRYLQGIKFRDYINPEILDLAKRKGMGVRGNDDDSVTLFADTNGYNFSIDVTNSGYNIVNGHVPDYKIKEVIYLVKKIQKDLTPQVTENKVLDELAESIILGLKKKI